MQISTTTTTTDVAKAKNHALRELQWQQAQAGKTATNYSNQSALSVIFIATVRPSVD